MQRTILKSVPLLMLVVASTGWSDPNFELTGSMIYKLSSGSVSSTPSGTPTKLDSSELATTLGFGYFIGDQAEAIFETEYSQTSGQVAEFTTSETNLMYGLGLLFNLPLAEDEQSDGKEEDGKDSKKSKSRKSKLARANWIPYLGFLISQSSVGFTSGQTEQSTIDSGDLNTRLIFGLRYMIFPRVALNWSLRLAYQNTTSAAKAPDELGGSLTKLEAEARLISLSMFF